MFRLAPDWERVLEENLPFWVNISAPKRTDAELADTLFVELTSHGSKLLPTERSNEKVVRANGLELIAERKGRLCNLDLRLDPSSSSAFVAELRRRIGGNEVRHAALSPFNSFKPLQGSILASETTNGLAVFAGENGQLRVFSDLETQKPNLMRELNGHLGDVNTVRFFPSGKVILSGGADIALKIWDLESGLVGAQLKGHSRGVLDCDFVERGRNVVSASRDGSVILHDVPSQSVIAKWVNPDVGTSALNCVRVLASKDPSSTNAKGEEGKVLCVGSESGAVLLFDVRSRAAITKFQCLAAVNAVIGLLGANPLVVAGGDWSGLSTFDLRKTDAPISESEYSAYGRILRLAHNPASADSIWVSHAQGVASLVNPTSASLPAASLVSDSEPLNGLSFYSEGSIIVTAARNGIARAYNVKSLS